MKKDFENVQCKIFRFHFGLIKIQCYICLKIEQYYCRIKLDVNKTILIKDIFKFFIKQ